MTATEGAEEGNSNNDIMTYEDDEDSRDSYESFDVDDVIRRIGGREADDYKMSKLTIGEGYYLPNHGDWEVLGRAVGKNAYLREVAFYDDIFEHSFRKKNLLKFLPGFAMNRSIQKLRLTGLNLNDKPTGGLDRAHPSEELLNMFAQFFNNNAAFEFLEVDEESVDKLRAIASLLQRCSSLKELILVNENAWSQCGRTGESVRYINRVDTVLEALIGHTGLRKLTIADAKIGVGGSNSLAMILQNPTINLTSLTLNASELYDSRRSYRGLDYYFNHDKDSDNESDKEEDVDKDGVGVETVKGKDEEIDVDTDDEDDETAAQAAKIFASGLCGNVSLKELEISHMGYVTSRQNSAHPENTIQISTAGWRAIFVALQSSKCGLEKLSLHENYSIGASILSLPSALQNHTTTLKTLNLRSMFLGNDLNMNDGDSRWTAFFQFLQDPKSALEVFDLSYNDISDEGLHALATALEGNSRLRELNLDGNSCDTETGWEAFSGVLRCSNSALEKLDMKKCCIKINAFISIVNSLANNNRLIELQFQLHTCGVTVSELDSHNKSVVSDCGTALFLNILCNESSILSTYNSNHTLTKVYKETVKGNCTGASCTHYSRSNDLQDLLAINANNSVSQAARLKIIKTHCIIDRKKSTQILSYKERELVTMILLGQRKRQMNMQPFVDMDVSVRAHALAWMARDQYLYHFLRAMPSLLEIVVSKKRTIGLVE